MKSIFYQEVGMNKLNDDQIESIKCEICDHYCKFPEEYLEKYDDSNEANEAVMSEVCIKCPLNKL